MANIKKQMHFLEYANVNLCEEVSHAEEELLKILMDNNNITAELEYCEN